MSISILLLIVHILFDRLECKSNSANAVLKTTLGPLSLRRPTLASLSLLPAAQLADVAGTETTTVCEKREGRGIHRYVLSRDGGTCKICYFAGVADLRPECTALIQYMLPHGDGDVGLGSDALGLAFNVLAPNPGGLRWQEWEPCNQAPDWIEFKLLGRFQKVCRE